jgi:hypothetical protein
MRRLPLCSDVNPAGQGCVVHIASVYAAASDGSPRLRAPRWRQDVVQDDGGRPCKDRIGYLAGRLPWLILPTAGDSDARGGESSTETERVLARR